MCNNRPLAFKLTWEEQVKSQLVSFRPKTDDKLAEQLQRHLESTGPNADFYLVNSFSWKINGLSEMFFSILAQHRNLIYSSVLTSTELLRAPDRSRTLPCQ